MKRIILIGSGGAGKSTLAKKLGHILDLPVYHLDAFFWKEGWVPSTKEEFLINLDQLLSEESWIMDGNFGSTMDRRISVADTIIFLHFSRWVCIWRVLKRRIRYHKKTRPDMGNNCEEKLDYAFLKWIWEYPNKKAPEVLKKLGEVETKKRVIILTSPKELTKFLKQLEMSRQYTLFQ